MDALPIYIEEDTIALFERTKVLSRNELHSIFVVYTERYNKQLNIETSTAIRMARNEIYPAIMRYMNNIASSINSIRTAIGAENEEMIEGDIRHLIKF